MMMNIINHQLGEQDRTKDIIHKYLNKYIKGETTELHSAIADPQDGFTA